MKPEMNKKMSGQTRVGIEAVCVSAIGVALGHYFLFRHVYDLFNFTKGMKILATSLFFLTCAGYYVSKRTKDLAAEKIAFGKTSYELREK